MRRFSSHSFLRQPPSPCDDPLLFVIGSVPGFPASLLSPANTDVVLSKENHMQLTEAATLDRKSGQGEGSAVRHSCAPLLPAHNLRQSSPNPHGNTNSPLPFRVSRSGPRNRRSLGFDGMTKRRGSSQGEGGCWMKGRCRKGGYSPGIFKSNLDSSGVCRRHTLWLNLAQDDSPGFACIIDKSRMDD
jgi:hypothetical protein